eukprot:TRINITY_DN48308_c0_g1_i1.p2 TRINITY_DN48308_c0_g1~~TRINITY_DN48308_c0_g1_i1.p2  ORF type:complete len:207 (+),score=38.34 TRINITY_DN48308_c0_g1_i1:125-745(+)
MTKKGLSLEQKREKVLEIFHSDDDVYQLKEIEKLAAAKGVTIQSVKDVVWSLVDDSLVHQDKIGISNFLWSFAAEASTKAKAEEKQQEDALRKLEGQLTDVIRELDEAKAKDDDHDLRTQLLAEIDEMKSAVSQLEAERASLAEVDPERFKAMQEAAVIARDSANRWLDNTHALHDWCKSKFQGRESDVENFFKENGLTDKLETLD